MRGGQRCWREVARKISCVVALTVLVCLTARTAVAQAVPPRAELAPAARAAIQSAALTDAERAELRLRHGTWDDADLTTPEQRAIAALGLWQLESPALVAAGAPAWARAAAFTRTGQPERALEALANAVTATDLQQRALALEQLGRPVEAAAAARAAQAVDAQREGSVADRLAAIESTALLARVEGAPARDWQRMLDELAAVREHDRLDPRPRLIEGRLLVDKDRYQEGVAALREALSLDIRSSEAWYLLGRVALMTFDFDGARTAATQLRELNTAHPLAALLEAEIALQSRAPDEAQVALEALLEKHPQQRDALAFQAAADAMLLLPESVKELLARLDVLSPGSPNGYYQVGRFLALLRQYDEAATALNEAARRAPAWSTPIAELGLLEMQSGRDAQALAALARAVELDPFDERARFSRKLMEMLGTWPRLESKHFIVRYKPGTDEVIAAMMPDALDAMHAEICLWLGHEPAQKTVIELHPDHRSFAVRITGMPWIHTIAASTGPVIALEAPREGAPGKHLGRFDWLEVLRHEYVHTVTLDQTRNRIPHWFTEAIAVRLETKPRTFETAQMLAAAYTGGTLFGLDEINWAFVRPKRPDDRPLAYAQGNWMVQFMNRRFGMDALVRLLGELREGVPEKDAFVRALGVSREEFHRQFLAFAADDVKRWGLSAEPPMRELVLEAARRDPEAFTEWDAKRTQSFAKAAELIAERIGVPGEASTDGVRGADWPSPGAPPVTIDDALVADWLERLPNHPDVLELAVRRRLEKLAGATPGEDDLALLARYAAARPVDPYPHRQLAKLHRGGGDPSRAIPSLIELDAREENDHAFAIELARLYRAERDHAAALAAIRRAVRIDPYDPALRELSAAIAVEAGDLRSARRDVEALTLLEPDREQHRKRLARLDELLARPPAGG